MQFKKDSELTKYYKGAKDNNYFLPKYDSRIQLFAAAGAGKPEEKPLSVEKIISPGGPTATAKSLPKPAIIKIPVNKSIYTSATFGSFIDEKGDKKKWFTFNLKNAPKAANVVWQVADVQFSGGVKTWKNPAGLLKTGKVPATAKEFSVDFSDPLILKTSIVNTALLKKTGTVTPEHFRKNHKCYYVRAVPVDATGKPIGDPAKGIAVIYGKQLVNQASAGKISTTYELWTPGRSNLGEYHGEFQDPPSKRDSISMDPHNNADPRVFYFHGADNTEAEIVLQISDKPFTTDNDTPGSSGLLYEEVQNLPVDKSGAPSGFPIGQYPSSLFAAFGTFAKQVSEMQNNQYITYYARGLIIKNSSMPGYIDEEITNTVIIQYGYGTSNFTFYVTPTPVLQIIGKSLPTIKIKAYTPIQWQAQDSFSHYIVYRMPTADEITCSYQNVDTQVILYPYDTSDIGTMVYYQSIGITNKQQYEQIEIPKVLNIGTKVYFPPPVPENKSWYEELWDDVVDFFKDLWSIADQLVDTISAAYSDLKSDLINFVVDLCPIDSLKGAFQTILEGMVNYGLVVVGLPPSIPNFDDLSSMSIDYIAETAMTEAGVPADQMTEDAVNKVVQGSKGLAQQIVNSANRGAPNPVGAPFLKLDPDYIYRPAYVDVELSNDSNEYTVAGTFDLEVTFEFNYNNMYANSYDPLAGIFYTSPNPYAVGSDAALTTSLDYINHFEYGLNGYTLDYAKNDTAIYDVFAPVIGQTCPILRPHEDTMVRIYLEPYHLSGAGAFPRYPTGEGVTDNDYDVMYFGNGNKEFTNFYITGDFPTAAQYMQSQNYINTNPHAKIVYTYDGSVNDAAKVEPVSVGWSR